MEEAQYQKMFEMEDSFWWFKGKQEILLALFQQFVGNKKDLLLFDIGCGTGGWLVKLNNFGKAYGLDLSPLALDLCKKRGLRTIVQGTGEALPFLAEIFDVVTAVDFFYHRQVDNEKVMQELSRILKKGGIIIFSDSALKFLRGPHDKAMHGKTRYSIREVQDLLSSCGFQIKKISYSNFILFPVILTRRLWTKWTGRGAESDVQRIPSFLNRIFFKCLQLEAILLPRFRFPFGSSVICVARKPQENG